MTPTKLLTAIGEAMFGPYWQVELAKALGKNARTMRRYVSGEYAISAEVWLAIRALAAKRARDLGKLGPELEAMQRKAKEAA